MSQSARWVLVVVIVAAAGGVTVWRWQSQSVVKEPQPSAGQPAVPSVPVLSEADLAKAIELRNRGNAHLENSQFDSAATDFDELCRLLPDEPLGFRNRAIGSLLSIEAINRSTEGAKFTSAVDRTRQHLAEMRRLEPQSAATHILAGRLAIAMEDLATAETELSAALELDPRNAALWYELSQLTRLRSTPTSQQATVDALKRAHEFAPTNLFVLLDDLQALATAQDPSIRDTLTASRETIVGIAAGVQKRIRIDPLELLDQALRAAEQGDWKGVERGVRVLSNVIRPDDAAQSDKAQIEVHSLEFMHTRFVTLQDADAQLAQTNAGSEPEFVFTPDPHGGALATATGVLDALWADIDLDGRDEVWLLREGALEVYARASSEADWSLLTSTAVPAQLDRLLAADLDQDVVETTAPADAPAGQLPEVCHAADIDCVAYGAGGLVLLRNEVVDGQRQLVAVAEPTQPLPAVSEVRFAIAGDVNSDGDLDLVLATAAGMAVWSNRGSFVFAELPLPQDVPSPPTAVTPVDLDRDVDLDLVLGLESGQLGYLENLRHGTFRWRAIATAAAPGPVRAVDVIDTDSNASWDVTALTSNGLVLHSTRWIQPGEVQFDLPRISDAHTAAQGLLFGDFNNSGRSDLLTWGLGPLTMTAGTNDGSWEAAGQELEAAAMGSRSSASDIDGDGDLDLLTLRDGGVALLMNTGNYPGGWVELGLVAQQVKGTQSSASGRVNHFGLGSLVELRSGPHYQARVVRGPRTHFGLGEVTSPDALRVVWTNGIPENLIEPAQRQFLCERQTLKGSCPYLYAWNGERFDFVTDLLWASPIGLVNPTGDLVPCREWEHVLIPGAALQPAEGEYRLSITEELWEAAYFDRVELVAVDHPAEIAVFTNEKVGPASIAAPKLHTARQLHRPIAAVDQHGRDLLPLLSEVDERYAAPYLYKLRQGYTEETFIELDLGLTEQPQRLTLFLTGWIYPTDTSINIGLSEDASLPGPRPPSILTPDAQGVWQEVIPFCGFPGGKTKTIAVEVPGEAFVANDFRLRMATSLELAWDRIAFTVDEPAGEVRTAMCPLLVADLHYRGFSAPISHPDRGPERYDYARVTTSSQWPPMQGRFTRYGDVTELLTGEDDCSVVLGSGDEMLVRFAVPATDPPPGWVRDFVLRSIGWDKDADLHTVYGQTVEPLPFRGMSRYPYQPEESFPETPEVGRYLLDYQTREFDLRSFARPSLATGR